MREINEIFIPLKKSHSGNVQQNMDDVVILAISSSRSNPIQAPQRAVPPSDAHVRCSDVSSHLGPTRSRRGAYGGAFLRQGFAYA
jgi:hypothetical protein